MTSTTSHGHRGDGGHLPGNVQALESHLQIRRRLRKEAKEVAGPSRGRSGAVLPAAEGMSTMRIMCACGCGKTAFGWTGSSVQEGSTKKLSSRSLADLAGPMLYRLFPFRCGNKNRW